MAKINVQNAEITIVSYQEKDYISLTDMANARIGESRAADVIKNWLRNRYTLEFLGTWEAIHNPRFKVVEFDHFKSQAGLPGFVLSVSEWIEKTDAEGIIVKKGKYGGTYAHKDIAFEFGSAISIPFTYPKSHAAWNDLRNYSKFEFVALEDIERVKVYAEEHEVVPLLK